MRVSRLEKKLGSAAGVVAIALLAGCSSTGGDASADGGPGATPDGGSASDAAAADAAVAADASDAAIVRDASPTTDAATATDGGKAPAPTPCPNDVCLRWAVLPVLGPTNTQFDICIAFVDDNTVDPPQSAIAGPISANDNGPGFTIPSVTNYFTFSPDPPPGKKVWTRLVKKGAPDCTVASKFLPGTTLVDPTDPVPQGYSTLIIYGNPNNLASKFASDPLLDRTPPSDEASIRFFNGLADGTKVAVTSTDGAGGNLTIFPDTPSYQFGQNPSFTMTGDFLQVTPFVANPVQLTVNGSTIGFTNFMWQGGGVYSLFSFGTGGSYGGFVCEDMSTLVSTGQNANCTQLHM